VYVPFEYGWTAYSFQLIVVGAPVAANCTLQAQPSVSGQWSALPVQNGFSNTLNPGGATGANSRRLSYVKGGGLLRFRFNCGAAFPAETAYALFAAAA
jgi:hypothetical protein